VLPSARNLETRWEQCVMDFLETLLPLRDAYQAFIPATLALMKLGCEESKALVTSFGHSEHPKIRIFNLRCLGLLSGPNVLQCKLAPIQSEEAASILRQDLRHGDEVAREASLEFLMEQPFAQLFADVVPLLTAPSQKIREMAAEYLKIGATTDEGALSALFPHFDYSRWPRDEQRETEDLWVRLRAIESLYFEHGSKRVQDKLVAVFDRPGLGIKKALTNAFNFCPGKADLRERMLERTNDANPENALSAWYVLGVLKDQELRPKFHQLLRNENAYYVQAGLFGLFPMLTEVDIPELKRCQQAWRPSIPSD
jgi:hypothetical protein